MDMSKLEKMAKRGGAEPLTGGISGIIENFKIKDLLDSMQNPKNKEDVEARISKWADGVAEEAQESTLNRWHAAIQSQSKGRKELALRLQIALSKSWGIKQRQLAKSIPELLVSLQLKLAALKIFIPFLKIYLPSVAFRHRNFAKTIRYINHKTSGGSNSR